MLKRVVVLGFAGMAVWLSTGPVGACGDKLLVLGHGVRFQVDTADFPASILLYMNPNLPGSAAVGDTQLQGVLRQAGHRLRSVNSREEIAAALKAGRYDLVLADFSDAPGLEEIVRATPSHPMLLPWVYQEPKAAPSAKERYQSALRSAKQRYRAVLKAPASVGFFLSTIDRAMELKSKQVRAGLNSSPSTTSSLAL